MADRATQKTDRPEIRTAGQLREYLVEMMVKLEYGQVRADEVSRITKLAAQVNESFYSEIKIRRVLKESGASAEQLTAIGALPINR